MLQSAKQSKARSTGSPKDDRIQATKSEVRGRPRSGEAEEAILAATIQLLSEKHLRDISIEEIARKANVGKTTIYKWWSSKASVALDAFLRKINRMVPMPDTGSVKGDILEHCRSLIAFYRSSAGRILGQFVAESESDKELASLFRERFLKPRREAAGVIFDRGIQRGEIDKAINRELVLDMIYGPTIFRLFVGHSPLEDKLADDIVSILFMGLEKERSNHPRHTPKPVRKRSPSRASN